MSEVQPALNNTIPHVYETSQIAEHPSLIHSISKVKVSKDNSGRLTVAFSYAVKAPLFEHLKRVKKLHEKDLQENFGRVYMPFALDWKYPKLEKNGDGNMFFLLLHVLTIRNLALKGDIMFMSQFCKRQ